MFVNIDETFFIKEKITQKKLQECILFISNQTNIKKLVIKNAYKNYNLKKFNFPKELNKKDIDIVIKTKFNKDFKYINLDKSKIASKINRKTKSSSQTNRIKQLSIYIITLLIKQIKQTNQKLLINQKQCSVVVKQLVRRYSGVVLQCNSNNRSKFRNGSLSLSAMVVSGRQHWSKDI